MYDKRGHNQDPGGAPWRISGILPRHNQTGGGVSHCKTEHKHETNKIYRVQVGAYTVKENAENMLVKLKNKGFDGFIVESNK